MPQYFNNHNKAIVARHFTELDSTNAEAIRQLRNGGDFTANETFITTDFQIAGRGQAENKWFSSPGKNYLGSLIYYPKQLSVDNLFALTQATSLAVVEIIRILTNEVARIKWPNDIYIGDKKVAGILIQNSIAGSHIQWSVIGLGLNINEVAFPDVLQEKATSLVQFNHGREIEMSFARETIFATSLAIINQYLNPPSLIQLKRDYLEKLYLLNVPADYMNLRAQKQFRGTIRGVTKDGLLQVEHSIGRMQTYDLKEIGFI